METREKIAWGLLALVVLVVCGGLGLLAMLPSPEPTTAVEYVDRVVTEVVTKTIEVEVYVEKEPEGPIVEYRALNNAYWDVSIELLYQGGWELDLSVFEYIRLVDTGVKMLVTVEYDAAYLPADLDEALSEAAIYFTYDDSDLENLAHLRQQVIQVVTESTVFEEYMGITPVIVGEAVSMPPERTPVCDCSYDRYNCKRDFTTHRDAQACYGYCWSRVGYDVHGLDGDGNGIACESLP